MKALRTLVRLVATVGLVASGEPRLTIEPASAKPGDPVLLTLRGVDDAPDGTLGDRALHFAPIPGGFQAIAGLPVEQAAGNLATKVSAAGHDFYSGFVEIQASGFETKQLTVDNKYAAPPPEVKQQIADDQAAFHRAFAHPFGPRLFQHNFVWPRPPKITAPFGDQRTFNGEKKSQHYGVDLQGKTGDPILAANDGIVVLVRGAYASGNTTIIDHGEGLFTLYFHQSKTLVHEGERVKRGQRIGLVGRTGRVTGPHLHFGAWIDGLYVNGAALLGLDFQ